MNVTLTSEASVYFSSALPDLIVSGIIGNVGIKISRAGKTVYSSRIYVDTEFNFDLSSALVLAMQVYRLPYSIFSVTVTPEDTGVSPATLQLEVLFSRGKSNLDASLFASSRFLTLTDTKLVPANAAFDSVSVYVSTAAGAQALLELTYKAGDDTITHQKTYMLPQGYSRIDINFQQIIDDIAGEGTGSPVAVTPVSASLVSGNRKMRYFFTQTHPASAVSFLNQFNAPEHFWSFGSWRRTGKVTQKNASCASLNVPHSLEVKPEFEVTTHSLDFRQAYIIPEMAMSPLVWVYLFAEGAPLATAAFQAIPETSGSQRSALASASFKAIPTEGALDASPFDSDPVQYAVKFIAADDRAALGFQFEIHRIFTEQFQNPFI